MTSQYTHRILDESGVGAVLDAAEQYAIENSHRVVIVVVERSGELVGLRRTPGAQIASSRVAVDKARTAAKFIRPSRELEQQVSSGRLGALALHGARALTGGIPLKVGDEVVGAIGTSGETPDEDEAVSRAGGERGGGHGQGAHGSDLPPTEQGLRGPGVGRARVGAPSGPRGASEGW